MPRIPRPSDRRGKRRISTHTFHAQQRRGLEYPYGEKVEDETNLFAIRIRKGGNARFFYAYDDGTAVWILNGYEKKTERIPKQELKRARQLKRKYEL